MWVCKGSRPEIMWADYVPDTHSPKGEWVKIDDDGVDGWLWRLYDADGNPSALVCFSLPWREWLFWTEDPE